MRKLRSIPYELALLMTAMAYNVIGLLLSVCFYGEPMPAGLPAGAVLLGALFAAVVAGGYDRTPFGRLARPWQAGAWAALLVSSLMLVLEIGYMYAPDGIANTMPLFPAWAYEAAYGAELLFALAALRLHRIRWRGEREADKRLVAGVWRK